MSIPFDPDERLRTRSERIHVQSRTVLSAQWATLEHVTFRYLRNDGRWQEQQREIYHRGHGAAILLYNKKTRKIVLIRQFRFPAWTLGGDGFLLEVPAGIIEQRNPEATVLAETLQETGFDIASPQFLFKVFATPGSVTEQLHCYAAEYDSERKSGSGGGLEAEGEDIEVLEVDLDIAAQWVASGEIVDAKSILLIQYAQLHIFAT